MDYPPEVIGLALLNVGMTVTVVFVHISLGEIVTFNSAPGKGMLPRDPIDVTAFERIALSNNVASIAASGFAETRFINSHFDSFFHPLNN